MCVCLIVFKSLNRVSNQALIVLKHVSLHSGGTFYTISLVTQPHSNCSGVVLLSVFCISSFNAMTKVTLRPADIQAIITRIATHPEAMESVAQLIRTTLNNPTADTPTNSALNNPPQQANTNTNSVSLWVDSTASEAANSRANSNMSSQQPTTSGKYFSLSSHYAFFFRLGQFGISRSGRPTCPLCHAISHGG